MVNADDEVEFESLFDAFPDWPDAGRSVEVMSLNDPFVHRGVLLAEDVWFDGEDEVPIFFVGGAPLSGFDFIRYLG